MTPRKQPARETSRSTLGRLPLPEIRRKMFDQACELIAAGDPRELSLVIGNRFHISQSVVNRVLVLEGLRHEREAAALRAGIHNAVLLAREAGQSVYETDDFPESAVG